MKLSEVKFVLRHTIPVPCVPKHKGMFCTVFVNGQTTTDFYGSTWTECLSKLFDAFHVYPLGYNPKTPPTRSCEQPKSDESAETLQTQQNAV